jgi:hypothetical protein
MRSAPSIIALLLLAGVAVALLMMPRVNYGVLVSRQNDADAESKMLAGRLSRLERLTQLERDPGRLAAILETVDMLPELLHPVQEQLAGLERWSSDVLFRLEELSRRIAALEDGRDAAEVVEELETPRSPGGSVDLPPELRRTADRLSARGLAEGELEDFFQAAVHAGLLPLGLDVLSGEFTEELARRFALYKTNIGLINYNETLHVHELAEEAASRGDFVDVPFTAGPEALGKVSLTEPGFLHLKRLEAEGVQRLFRFPYPQYPELIEYETRRQETRDRLVRDVAALLAAGGER